MRLVFLLLSGFFLLNSCNSGSLQKGDLKTDSLSTAAEEKPASDTTLLSYWDSFDFGDMNLIKSPQVGEQKFANFLADLPSVPDSVANTAIRNHLLKAEISKSALDYYIQQYEHYLYDPNSPMRNELYYKPVLEYLISSPGTEETAKVRYEMILKLVDQNMPGTLANDFAFEDSKGKNRKLHEVEAVYKMLFFYDPTCETCAGKISDLQNSSLTNELIDAGQLTVLAVSLNPERSLWRDDQDAIPLNWINGFNTGGTVITKGLYNILAYPTIYLLDKENKVILKDAPLDVTLRELFKLTGKA